MLVVSSIFVLDVFFLGREQPISGSNAPIETSLKLRMVSSSKHGECLFRSYKRHLFGPSVSSVSGQAIR